MEWNENGEWNDYKLVNCSLWPLLSMTEKFHTTNVTFSTIKGSSVCPSYGGTLKLCVVPTTECFPIIEELGS